MVFQKFYTLILAVPAIAGLALAGDAPDAAPKAPISSTPTAAEYQPMTRSERFRQYVSHLADAESIVRAAASAGIRQAENSPKEWQQGGEGYGYRVGDAFAEHVLRRTLQYGASVALHEDNRYFLSGQEGFGRRLRYAVKSTFMARKDNGDQRISFSRIGGDAGAAFISRIWQPRSTTSAGDGAVSFGFAFASDVGFNVFREFWPDLKRHFHKN